MTRVAEAILAATQQLAPISDTARLDAELLMAHALQMRRSDMLLRTLIDATEAPPEFFALIRRRTAREPLAYILGHQEFRGHSFRVSPAVLIPRGDSETLIEAALRARPEARRVLDCGTGSGALLISTLLAMPDARGVGIDRSQAALLVAENNAQRLGLTRRRAEFLHADWDEVGWADGLGQFDLILANPPYVEDDAELMPDVREFEPTGALFAGAEGLDAYRVLIPQLPALLAGGGVALVEIGPTQAEAVGALASAAGLAAVLHHDLAGRPRVLELKIPLGKTGASP
jgi:release factor glutamine methyltransferase